MCLHIFCCLVCQQLKNVKSNSYRRPIYAYALTLLCWIWEELTLFLENNFSSFKLQRNVGYPFVKKVSVNAALWKCLTDMNFFFQTSQSTAEHVVVARWSRFAASEVWDRASNWSLFVHRNSTGKIQDEWFHIIYTTNKLRPGPNLVKV